MQMEVYVVLFIYRRVAVSATSFVASPSTWLQSRRRLTSPSNQISRCCARDATLSVAHRNLAKLLPQWTLCSDRHWAA